MPLHCRDCAHATPSKVRVGYLYCPETRRYVRPWTPACERFCPRGISKERLILLAVE